MKIFRIIARLNVGGPSRHVVWLTKGLQNEEFQSVLATGTVPEGEEDMGYFADENGVRPFYIEQMSRELSPKDIISLWKVFIELWREKPDIIHTHTAKAGTIGRIAGLIYHWLSWRNVKMVHTFHGHVFHSYYGKRKTHIFLLIEKILARFASDKIITISDQQFREIHEEFGVGKKEQFAVIPLGIDLEKFADSNSKRNILRDEIGVNDSDILVGLVGRLTEIKNHSLFLRVIVRCQQDSEMSKLKFAIIGDGHTRELLEAEAKSLGIKDKVIFVGHRNDVDVVYAALDIVALTSLNEGTPLSLIEAMASGKCVISTEVGGVVDLLGDAENETDDFKVRERGVSVESNNEAEYFNGLQYLAKNQELQRQFGEKGLNFVHQKYSKERLLKDIAQLYREISL
jgi:glycosyltransferase involved in cell wall biosynthesis